MRTLTAQRLREVLNYDCGTGAFTWRQPAKRANQKPGDSAGCVSRGRVQIQVDGHIYRAHRLAWLYVTGAWPQHEIDHINGEPADNRFVNLRDVTSTVNHQNRRTPQRRNKVGLLGVSPAKQKVGFRARIDRLHLGVFQTPQAAHAAYVQAKRELHEGGML